MNYQQRPDDIEEIFRKIAKGLEKLFGSGGAGNGSNGGGGLRNKKGNFPLVRIVIAGFVLIFLLFTSFYTVEPDEEAVVLRLGRFSGTYPPGLHFKIPFGVDQVIKVPSKQIRQEEFGFRTSNSDSRVTEYSRGNFDQESLMLTGDLNVADVEWIVQYQISDPQKYLFATSDPRRNIRDVSEAIMRRVVGDRLVNDVLTRQRTQIATEGRILIQEVLDRYDMGVRIVTVELQDVNPPESVKPSFNEVNAARQEQEKLINQAEEKYNKVIPQARGQAEQQISNAEGFATGLVNRAQGDADRFLELWKEYRRAPQVTRDRLYYEQLEKTLKRAKSLTVIDPNVKGLLPVFEAKNQSTSQNLKLQQ